MQSSERSCLAFLFRPFFYQGLSTGQDSTESFFIGMGNGLPSKKAGGPIHTGTIVGIVLAVLLIATIILAGIYINSHPTSNTALFFIEVSGEPYPWLVYSYSAINTNPNLPEESRGPREEERGTLIEFISEFLFMVLQSQLISQPPVDDVLNLGSLPPTLFYFAPFHTLPFTHCLFSPMQR